MALLLLRIVVKVGTHCARRSFYQAATDDMSTARANTTATATERLTGTCRWFDAKRGYGFVVSDTDGSDFFVHQTAIQWTAFASLSKANLSFVLAIDENGRTKASEVVCGESELGGMQAVPREDEGHLGGVIVGRPILY